MTTLSAPVTISIARTWLEELHALKLEFATSTPLTLWISDRYVAASVFGQECLNRVTSFGTIEEALNTTDVGGTPSTATMDLNNTEPIAGKARFSDLIRSPLNQSGTYEWGFARLTVYQVVAGEAVPLGVFFLEEPTDVGEMRLTIRMSDQALAIEHRLGLPKISKDLFPNADPDDVGQPIPIPFGVLKNVPARAIVAGATAKLSADITATSPGVGGALSVGDTSQFPPSTTIQIDDEELTSSSKPTSTTLTVAARGVAGTLAAPHKKGAPVWEIRSGPKAFRYVVGQNRGAFKIKSVTNIKVDEVLQPQATVDLDDTTLVPGKSFAVINFPAQPVLKKQVVVSLDDQLTVGDNIAVSSPSVTTVKVAGTSTPTLSLSNPSQNSPRTDSRSTTVSLPSLPGPIISTLYTVVVSVQQGANASTFRISASAGGGSSVINGVGALLSGTYTLVFSGGYGAVTVTVSWFQTPTATVNNGSAIVTVLADATGNITINKAGAAFRGGSITISGNSTADVVVGGLVTCDVEGLQDDGAGTISGTPNLLFENPTDITKLLLLDGFGVATGDLGSSLPTTRAAMVTAGLKWAFLLEPATFTDLRKKLGEQAAAQLYLERGLWEYRFFGAPPAVMWIDEFRVPNPGAGFTAEWLTQLATLGFTAAVPGGSVGQLALDYLKDFSAPVKVDRSLIADVRTRLWIYSARDYRQSGSLGDIYTRVHPAENFTVHDEVLEDDVTLDLVQDPTTADLVGAWLIREKYRQRFGIAGVADWNVLGLDKIDLVTVSNHPVLAAHGGAGLAFRVKGKRYVTGDPENPAKIEIRGVEANA
jgi:hypothetical protein